MEKTFEKLIKKTIDKGDAFTPTGIIEMMKQVREATIAECIDKISELHGSIYKVEYQEHLATNLPIDRIKLTDK